MGELIKLMIKVFHMLIQYIQTALEHVTDK